MKNKILLFAALIAFNHTIKAQETKTEHSIKVIGTAEMEIVPDEIYMSITLKEYTKDKKKYTIDELEKNLVNYIEKVTITDKKDIKMDNINGYIMYLKRKNKDEVITKSYNIKFKNSQQVYQLYSVMDSLGISNAFVSKYSHSKMDEYKKQIKIDAIKSAREKANYLLDAIGEKVGKAIGVTELNGLVTIDDGRYDNNHNTYGHTSYNDYQYQSVSIRMEDGISSADSEAEVIGSKTIKLHYDINAEFAIQ